MEAERSRLGGFRGAGSGVSGCYASGNELLNVLGDVFGLEGVND